MAVEAVKWSVQQVPWDAGLLSVFLPAFDYDASQVDAMAAAVQAGGAECLHVSRGEVPAAWVVVRMDGPEFEILAAAGNIAGHSLTREVLPVLEEMAFERGAVAMRINTFRRGLMAELARQGYQAMHVTFWKRV